MAIVDCLAMGSDLGAAYRYRRDRQLAYRLGFDEFVDTAVEHEIAGAHWRVHPNVNLYVDLTAACNADCAFCIAKTTYQRKSIYRGELLDRAERAFDVLRHVNLSIQVVGGEPTISPIFDSLLCLSSRYGFRLPVVGTNGTGLTLRNLSAISDYGFRHVNLSRHHYHDDVNAEIMRTDTLPTSGQLARMVAYLHGDGVGVRLQCNLIGGYVDTYGELMQFLAYGYHRLGVDSFAFSQLTPLPAGDIYQQEIIDYVAQRQVDIDAILARVEADSRFGFVKFRAGVACYYEVWEYLGYERPLTVVVKYSDNQWLVRADELEGYIPDLILYTDGALCGSWNRHRKVILEGA